MSKLLTQKDYAVRRGVSKQYIGELVRKGVLPLKNGLIDPDMADAILEARREPARPQRRAQSDQPQTQKEFTPPGQRTITTAELPTLLLKTRIKSETEKVKLLEIKAKVEAGKFIDVDEVKSAAYRRGRTVRDNLLSIPDRLDAILAAETDRRKVHQILSDEITRVLDELTKPII